VSYFEKNCTPHPALWFYLLSCNKIFSCLLISYPAFSVNLSWWECLIVASTAANQRPTTDSMCRRRVALSSIARKTHQWHRPLAAANLLACQSTVTEYRDATGMSMSCGHRKTDLQKAELELDWWWTWKLFALNVHISVSPVMVEWWLEKVYMYSWCFYNLLRQTVPLCDDSLTEIIFFWVKRLKKLHDMTFKREGALKCSLFILLVVKFI